MNILFSAGGTLGHINPALSFIKVLKNHYKNINITFIATTKEKDLEIANLKERYKQYTGLDYPIINFSRLMVKSINVLNFLKLNNLAEIILDYNAPQGKSNEKEFLPTHYLLPEYYIYKNETN